MKHNNDVITSKNHTHGTVVFTTKHRLSLILLFLLSFPRYHPWFSSNFCDARRSSLSIALPSFDFVSCIEFHQFYRCRRHFPDTTPFVFFKYFDIRISKSSVTLSLLDCGSRILSCNSTRQFLTNNGGD